MYARTCILNSLSGVLGRVVQTKSNESVSVSPKVVSTSPLKSTSDGEEKNSSGNSLFYSLV